MKKLLIIMMVIAGSLVATSAKSQVHVSLNFERDYPGYTYYNYPRWNGHYRDEVYYRHYHTRFEREHRAYIRDRRFDHDRWSREHQRRDRRH